jgi:hypothetical protein
MANKQTTNETESSNKRQSRKEILRAQKHEEQMRIVRIAAIIVGAIILLVVIIAIVNEYFLMPNRSVATVNGQPVTLSDWQERVEYERAQRIMTLESQLESFNGDVGLVQQFSGQAIVELINENAEGMGEAVLDRVVEEEIMRQAVEARELLPTDDEIDARIGETFNYYGGDSPTPFPDPTETVAPTPSLTPIPVEGAEAIEAPPVEQIPTSAPPPTPTPVSAESFQQEFDELLADFNNLGVSEEAYRDVVENSIITERLMEVLAKEQRLPTEDMHASIFIMVFSDETEANQALDDVTASDYLTVWNTIRSRPQEPAAEDASVTSASEILWRTRDSYAASFGEEVTDAVFELPLNSPGEVQAITGTDGEPLYVIIQVSGREMMELSESEYEGRKQQLLVTFLDEQRTDGVEISELWRSRVPTSPVLDPKFRQPPTPAPDSGLEGLGDSETSDEAPLP